jgi:NAD(P)-dependent dehydrogenase (short-subunit alcohol dehydrogenase family)
MSHGRFDNPVIAALAGFRDIFRKQPNADKLNDTVRFDDKTCIITGANSGLGFALAVEMAKRGAHVIMAGRSKIPEAGELVKKKSGSGKVEMRYLDLSRIGTIHEFVDGLVRDGIYPDVTFLNAGVALPKAKKTESGQDEMFLVNYLSNVILTNLMIEKGCINKPPPISSSPGGVSSQQSAVSSKHLANEVQSYDPGTDSRDPNTENRIPRIIFISSDSHQGSSAIDYIEFGKFYDHGVSKGIENYSYFKFVLNTYATELSRRLNPDKVNVGVNVICPGPVHTNIIKPAPQPLRMILGAIFKIIFRAPAKAVLPVVYLGISDDFEGKTNEYLHMFNNKKMDPKVYIPEEGKKLWEESMRVWKEIDGKACFFLTLHTKPANTYKY